MSTAVHRGTADVRIATLALLLALPTALGCAGDAARGPMNAVVICLDTVRFDTFWMVERTGLEDEFSSWAERAIRFERAVAPSPWTLPSVASLLTGRYPNAHGAGVYGDSGDHLNTRLPAPLSPDVLTLPELLRLRGYRAVGFVDQSFFHPKFGLVRGFERVGHQVGREKLVSAAESWLRATVAAGSTTPFLLYLHFLDAHRHHMKSEEEILSRWETVPERVGEAAIETAPGDLCAAPDANWCRAYQVYAHSIWELRASLVQILERLQSLALLDRTVVVVYSDHGEEFADHRAEQERRGTDSRDIHGVGHGQSLYQELLHVPLLAWHPDRPAQRIDAVVNLVDVAPTLAAWLGERDLGSEWDGQSLAEPERLDAARTVFASEVAFGPVETAAFRGNWKRVVRTEPEERLLFDLSADPREKDPVTRPEIEAELDGLIDDYRANARPPGPGVMELQKAELKALQALGYVGDVEAE